MGYVAPTWQNGGPPALNAKNMQDISDNLAYVSNNMVNPNLLDNWYFGNPVNQRGQTSYTDSGYTIDRWKFGGYSQTITLATNGIIWDTNTGVWWGQTIENWDALVGKTVTVSALIGGNLYSVSGVVNNSDRISVVVSEKVTLEISPEQKGVRLVTYVTESTSVGAVLAIKLELGSQQTLAHKEYGVWVLNEIPKFGDQLAECQRYFEWVDVQLTTSFNGSTPYKVVKRTTPVFNYYSVNGTVGKISQYNSINNAWDDVEPSAPPTDLNLRSLALYVPNQITTRFRIAVSADL